MTLIDRTDTSRSPALAICVGAAKAGTTSLHATLAAHPEIAVTTVKETDFFVDEHKFEKGLDHYFNTYFNRSPRSRILFEADPIYMYVGKSIERIQCVRPDAKIIVMLRDPVSRAFSQYLYRMSYRRFDESFEQMCEREQERVRLGEAQRLEYGCLDRSLYAPQVRNIFRYFARQQVYFIVFEHLLANPEDELLRLQQWLGVTPLPLSLSRENESANARSVVLAKLLFHPRFRRLRGLVGSLFPGRRLRRAIYDGTAKLNKRAMVESEKSRLAQDHRDKLKQFFAADILELEEITGLNLDDWRRS